MPDPEMTLTQRQQLQALLVALVQDLVQDLERSQGADQPVDLDQPIGRLSRVEAIQQQHMAAATRQRQQLRLVQARAALERLASDPDDFGCCLRCEETIAWRRLLARPESTLCLRCQSASEAR